MRFLWPFALIGLVLPLIVIAVYLWTRRRRRKYAVTFASLSLIKQAQPERSRWRRLVPAGLLLAAIAALVLATARPQALLATSRSDTSIILTIDVSRSMCSTDVSPNRLAAAEAAARKFVDDQPGGTRMGLVAFAGSAQVLVPPTSDRDKLHEAIDGLTTSIGTAIGNGVLTSIDALSRVNPDVAPSTVRLTPGQRQQDRFASKYVPDVVVLLTDGAATTGVDPLDAARQASDRRVRVFTIGFGTTTPNPLVCTAEQFGGDTLGPVSGGGGFTPDFSSGRRGNFLQIDEPTLRSIAWITGGTYARAASVAQLERAFRELPRRVVTVKEVHELTVYLVALGALLVVGAVATSRSVEPVRLTPSRAAGHDDDAVHAVLVVAGQMARELDRSGRVELVRGRGATTGRHRHLAGHRRVVRLVAVGVAAVHLRTTHDELVADRVTVDEHEAHLGVRPHPDHGHLEPTVVDADRDRHRSGAEDPGPGRRRGPRTRDHHRTRAEQHHDDNHDHREQAVGAKGRGHARDRRASTCAPPPTSRTAASTST